jgi:CHAT domain-containing protein/Tfp pilus assembly protein PilF
MKERDMKRFVVSLLLMVFSSSMLCQTAIPKTTTIEKAGPIQRGAVVEEVIKDSAAEKAGFQAGDILLAWNRDDATGNIESPFDVSSLAIEQAPRGKVSLKGLRGAAESIWILEPGSWGLKTRPILPQDLLSSYLEGRKLAQSGKWIEAAEQWRMAAGHPDDSIPVLVRLWLLSQAANALAQERQWTKADGVYQQALQQAGEVLPTIRGLLLRDWANSYRQRSDWQNAEKYYQQSILENRKVGPESLSVALILDDLGTVSASRSDLVKAAEYYRQALEIREKLAPGSLEVAASFNTLGNVARQRGDLAKAEEYLRQGLEIRQKLAPGRLEVAASLSNLGNVMVQRGDLAKAETYYRQALEIRQKLAPGSMEVAASIHNLGILAGQRGDLAKAEENYQQALEIRQRLASGSLEVAASLASLGSLARQQGNLAKAEEYLSKALEIRQKLAPGSLDVALAFNNLGNVALQQGDLAKAEKNYQQALEIRQKLAPGSLEVAASLNNLGILARLQGDLTKAEEYHRRALAIGQNLAPGSREVAEGFNSLGNVMVQRGDLEKAEEYYRQGLEVRQKLSPNSLDAAASIYSLGNVAKQRGDLVKAEEYYRQAFEIRQKLAPGSLNLGVSVYSLGNVAELRGDLEKAEEYLRQALDITQKVAPVSLEVVGSLDSLGNVAEQRGDLTKTEQYRRQAVEIRQKLAPQSGDYADSLAVLAKVLRRQEQMSQAAQLYEQALDVLDKQMMVFGGSEEARAGFRSNHRDVYKAYIDLLVSQKQPELAFHVLERSRAQGLLETLAAAHVDIRKGVNLELVEKERLLRELLTGKFNRRMQLLNGKSTDVQVATVDKEIQEILKEYQEVEGRIRQASPGYAALTQPLPLSVKEVQQQLLDSDTLLLEYTLGEERSYAFVVTQDSIAVFPLPKRADIEDSARTLYRLLTNRTQGDEPRTRRQAKTPDEYKLALAKLSQMVLGPVGGQMNRKRLLVVSDGALQYIPFAILLNPQDPSISLLMEHEVVNLPSASVLAVLRHQLSGRKAAPKAVAVLADPVFDIHDDRLRLATKTDRGGPPDLSQVSWQSGLDRSAREVGLDRGGAFPRLPFSRREADAIYSIARQGDVTESLDFDASKEAAMNPRLRDYRIVHFATHGLLNSEHPELSGLVFSLVDRQGKTQDGFLRLLDIYNLDLNADLVVLSACQTALGKQIAEEGLVGLTRGFMYAGASRVVASLWKVDDEATAALMKKFYESMLKKRETPSQALRNSQMWISQQKQWVHPYYWAGFVLQGEWR